MARTAEDKRKYNSLRHGMSYTNFYKVWSNMISRCNNPKVPCYPLYGGRGIRVCSRWELFDNFKEDMYKLYLIHRIRYGKEDTTIDRIDNEGNYTPKNCRWNTKSEQQRNKRPHKTQKLFLAKNISSGEFIITNNQSAFSRKYKLSASNINQCLRGKGNRKRTGSWTFKYFCPRRVVYEE